MIAGYTSWKEQAKRQSRDVYAEFVRHAVIKGLITLPWPHDLRIIVGYDPQLLLPPPDKRRTFHERMDVWREGGDLKAHGMYDGGVVTQNGRWDIDNEYIDFNAIPPGTPSAPIAFYAGQSSGKTQAINNMRATVPRWGESGADPLADIAVMLKDVRAYYDSMKKPAPSQGKTDETAERFFVHVDMSDAEMGMLIAALGYGPRAVKHETGVVILDLDSRGGDIPSPLDVYSLFKPQYVTEIVKSRKQGPDYLKHDPTKRHKGPRR